MNMDKKELMFLISFLTRTIEHHKPQVKKMMLSKTTNQEHIEKVVDEVEKLGIILDKLNKIMEGVQK
tara:strand:- start:107 stop:307 length:201 start_codon:yes stop_codon:yes gene_type:complete